MIFKNLQHIFKLKSNVYFFSLLTFISFIISIIFLTNDFLITDFLSGKNEFNTYQMLLIVIVSSLFSFIFFINRITDSVKVRYIDIVLLFISSTSGMALSGTIIFLVFYYSYLN